jgi:hypothetical protein
VCQNLRREEYANYLRLTMTRSLGGVSHILRARISRQLFPYKPFPRQKTDGSGDDEVEMSSGNGEIEISASDKTEIKQEVPTDGNKEVNISLWTKAEQHKHDEKMRGWARWEVDKGAEVVRSTKCRRLTTNADKVCGECRSVSRDESFKADV